MDPDSTDGRRAVVLALGRVLTGMDIDELWAASIALGDSLSPAVLEDALSGRVRLTDHQHDVVAQAPNDRLLEMGLDHLVPYSRELDDSS